MKDATNRFDLLGIERMVEILPSEEQIGMQSTKLLSPYLFMLKILQPDVPEDNWETFLYCDLDSLLEHIKKQNAKEHYLHLINNSEGRGEMYLIHSIQRDLDSNGKEHLVLIDINHDEVLICPVPPTPFGGEYFGGVVYQKEYHWTMSSLSKKMLSRQRE